MMKRCTNQLFTYLLTVWVRHFHGSMEAYFTQLPWAVVHSSCCCDMMQTGVMDIQRWVSLVLVSLRVILTQSKEEVVLGRLQQLSLTICFTDAVVGVEGSATDCTHEPAVADVAESATPDVMFAK